MAFLLRNENDKALAARDAGVEEISLQHCVPLRSAAVHRSLRQLDFARSSRPFAHAMVAIDGSRFKAVNSRDRSFSRGSIERRIEQVEASIERYLSALETADRIRKARWLKPSRRG